MSANATVLTMPRSAVAMLLECAVVRFRGAKAECCWAWAATGGPMAERDFLNKMVTKRTARNPAFPQMLDAA
jgi:hypothetical protein